MLLLQLVVLMAQRGEGAEGSRQRAGVALLLLLESGSKDTTAAVGSSAAARASAVQHHAGSTRTWNGNISSKWLPLAAAAASLRCCSYPCCNTTRRRVPATGQRGAANDGVLDRGVFAAPAPAAGAAVGAKAQEVLIRLRVVRSQQKASLGLGIERL